MSSERCTERLRLRPIEPADREALHRLWTDPDVRRYLFDDRVIDLARVDELIGLSVQLFSAERYGLFSLHPLEGGALIGACGLYRFAPEREPELIYSLAPAYWGRGLAAEVSRYLIGDAFERLGFSRVLARTDTPNLASIRVMERLRMTRLGERVENGLPTVSYALTREAWLAKR